MPKTCAICEKRVVIGRQVSHAHNVTPRKMRPNLQRVRALLDGSVRRIWACTRCIRSGHVVKPPVRSWEPESAATPES